MFRIKYIVLVSLILVQTLFFAAIKPPKKDKVSSRGIRLSLGPVIGFYKIDKQHARNVTPRISALLSIKKEVGFGRDYRTFFLYGIDYFLHGVTFTSYYFNQDTLQLYDNKFAYKYAAYFQEINVPLQVKYSVNRENNSQYTQYFMIGYHIRYLLPANLKVSQNGNLIRSDNPLMKFKNHLISEQINAYVSATFGWQKNTTAASKAGFFIEANYRYGFSPYYFKTSYAASSLFINSSHLTLQIGIKF